MSKLTQAELEALAAQHQAAEARSMVKVVKAIVDNRLAMHEVDFDALTSKVSLINDLLDGDEQSEGFQAFAALSQKLANVELKGNQNSTAISALQAALNSEIESLSTRVDAVETEARSGREALDARITQLRSEYEAHVADKLAADNGRDTRLDDHKARIEALEASKSLVDGRLKTLEDDNTANKSAIGQIQSTLQAQANALQAELERAQAVEAELRSELETERARVDGLVTAQGSFATRQNVADASQAGAVAAISAMWDEAGIDMPAGVLMPDGSVSE